MPIDPHCTECQKVTGGCYAHVGITVTTLQPDGPGCTNCGWTGRVHMQAPHKPLGVTMCSVPCPACAPNWGTD